MDTEITEITQRLILIGFSALFGYIITWIAARRGFFTMPEESSDAIARSGWLRALTAFSIFFILQLTLGNPLFLIIKTLYSAFSVPVVGVEGGTAVVDKIPDMVLKGWAHIGIIVIVTCVLLSYYFSLGREERRAVWGERNPVNKVLDASLNYLTGAMSWFIIYPWVIVIGQILAIFTSLFFSLPPNDQDAVKLLREIQGHPYLLTITVSAIVTLVPIMEELLFRGFLQSWLKTLLGRGKAIAMTSGIFALFHFSPDQGITNLELLGSLFCLSCFMGFLKERAQSLWASIGLHSVFNLVSSVFVLAFG